LTGFSANHENQETLLILVVLIAMQPFSSSIFTGSVVGWSMASFRTLGLLWLAVLLQACASTATQESKAAAIPATSDAAKSKQLTDDFFTPKGALATASKQKTIDLPTAYPQLVTVARPQPFDRQVLLYNSPSNKAFFETAGLNVANTLRGWETFLKKYKFSYTLANELSLIERSSSGLLILPSTVALSAREKQAIIDFRGRGGSILSTWLTGVRDEKGIWQGFDFMEKVLDVKVLGDTSAHKDDIFLLPYGESPVSNVLLAGERVWLERAKHWLPLKLNGRNVAAQIMDWARSFDANKHTGAIVFDERPLAGSGSSRSVSFAYPERLWQTAEPKQLEAIHHNVLTWLLRLPNAYKGAWPVGTHSALLVAVNAAEVISDSDMAVASLMEQNGVRATYYIVSDHMTKSAANLKNLESRGHEIAFMGDSFTGFKGQPIATQASRLDKTRKVTQDSQVNVPTAPGFSAPTESLDKFTKELLLQRGFGHYIDTMESSEARLPFSVPSTNALGSTVVFPRTQRGPEDATEEGDVEEGIDSFLKEFSLASKMGAVAVIRMPTQSLLSIDDWTKVFNGLKQKGPKTWITTGTNIANWWRERERVKVQLQGKINHSALLINVSGTGPLKEPVVAFINLPSARASISIDRSNPIANKVQIVPVDQWRAAIVLKDLPAGDHNLTLTISD
jgi:hypothetical protein